MKRTMLLLMAVFLIGTGFLQAQSKQVWSLEQCITYAQENNLTLKQNALNAEYVENQYLQSRYTQYPNLNANSGFRISEGRYRDQTTFQVRDVSTKSANVGIESTTPVFEGFTLRNTITRNRLDWEAAVKDVEKARNDLSLNIAALYLQILLDKELLEAGRSQLEVVNLQVTRTGSLVSAGSLPEGSLLEMRSLAAREALNVTRFENNLALSLLDLAQALDLESPQGFDIETPTIGDITGFDLVDPNQAYQYSVETLPQIAANDLRLKSSEFTMKVARGYQYPRVSFSMGSGTDVSRYNGEPNFDFSRKIKDNLAFYAGVNLAIPIFNAYTAKTGIKNAKIGILNAQYALDIQKRLLMKEIQQASADANAALRQYQSGKSAVESYQESFRYTEKRFNVGMLNSVDYNVAKTELIKAQSDFIQSKYAYILRAKILDFYMGKPIVL
jgi:outer membrane protein